MILKYALTSVLLLSVVCAAEEPIDRRFQPAARDVLVGDWQGVPGAVAQVTKIEDANYEVVVLAAFDAPAAKPLAVLRGSPAALSGEGWTGTLTPTELKLRHGDRSLVLHHDTRPSPTLGEKPPPGAVVLFDGTSLEAWANKKGKEWLVEDGPAPWKIVEGGILEVIPGTGGGIITHRQFGDCHLHVEFRTLGAPSNSGVFLQARYEVNINETYGKREGTPNGGLDNCTPEGSAPKIRATRPPLEWQTFDIDFIAPRFDAAGQKTAPAVATVRLNGVVLYDRQPLQRPHGAAGRLGEAPTGPLMLQEHGMPLQFRNLWLVQK